MSEGYPFPLAVAASYTSTNDAVDTSKTVVNVYSFTSSPVIPMINIFSPEFSIPEPEPPL